MKNPIILLSIVAFATTSCTQSAPNTETLTAEASVKGQSSVKDEFSEANILQVAIGSKDHSTLVAGVQAASLQDVLSNAGPLTVFAPNNDAFAKLPDGTLDNLLKPENKETLARIIKFHASPGTFTQENMRDGQQMYMATGHYVKVTKDESGISVDGARILGSVKASNGIVHIVDAVMLPPEQ